VVRARREAAVPNWCENELTIVGPAEDIEACLAKISTGEYRRFDFRAVIPMPEEVAATKTVTWSVVNGEAVVTVKDPPGGPDGIDTEELVRKYGAKDWYDWCWQNWGTKWNAFEVEVRQLEGSAQLAFATAWTPPRPVVRALAVSFPALTFTLDFWEGGAEFCGSLVVRGGDVLLDTRTHYSGPRGG
jgi:hypothetical protein